MKPMKTFTALLFMAALFTTPAMAQKETKKTPLKEHKCTKDCTKEKHALVHGEKGHVCTDACKKAATGKM